MSETAPRADFVHLRNHTAYSLLEGALRIKKLPDLCRKHGMPAMAMTDTGNLFGAYEFSEAMVRAGVQPIIGCTLAVDCRDFQPERSPGARTETFPQIVLLAQNHAGWLNLSKLSSKSYLETDASEDPHVGLDVLRQCSEGLIALTGGPSGPINKLLLANHPEAAEALLKSLSAMFENRLYVELQRHGVPEENAVEGQLIDLAYARKLPLVATNDCYFPDREMYEAHDALICIEEGAYVLQDDRRRLTPEHYFKSPAEMTALFADLPEAIENTLQIARRCAFRVKYHDPILPDYETDGSKKTDEAEELRRQATEGLKARIARKGTHTDEKKYWDRLEYELGVIIGMGFPGYFLIVSDFMKWARAKNIPIGVRGSGATSIVAWAMDITNLDPLRFDLVFERFLNPERISMPDFDIDFCQERRQEVIEYVQQRYGYENVAQIITFGTLQARAVVRDVGRVLQMPYGQVDRICKMIPAVPGKPVTLQQAIDDEPRLQEMIAEDETVSTLINMALKLEGLYRHASTHAAGLVIGDRPLEQLVPLYRDPRSDMPVTQFHYKDAERVGLVKFDFLGLKTLTVIAKTEEMLARRGIEVRAQELEFDDAKSYEMLARGDSIGVFQLESAGMRDLLRQMRPDRIEDLIALVALYRPGPMESIPKYIACKHGREEPVYLHPLLEPILEETFGVMTYQEDVMQIARDMAGYSLGDADLLRRAMGKKIVAEMEKHKARFIEGSAKLHGVKKDIAEQIFDQAAKFAGYGFNKGHAAAYAQVAYQTAYLKANYPVEFLCAAMTLDIERTDRLPIFRQEAERLGIRVLPPDINRSEAMFSAGEEADGERVILYALAALKNVGRAAMDHLVAVRNEGGPFKDLSDFANRIDPKQVNKRALEGLAKAGAFDKLNDNRAQVLAAVDRILNMAATVNAEREDGQANLFGGADAGPEALKLPVVERWQTPERLTNELEAIGFYLSGHPLDDYDVSLRRSNVIRYADLLKGEGRGKSGAKLAGTVSSLKEKKSAKSGRSFAVAELSDPSGAYEVWIFSEQLEVARDLMQPGAAVVVSVAADWSGEDVRLTANRIMSIDRATADAAAGLKVFVDDPICFDGIKTCLERKGKGGVTLVLELEKGMSQVDFRLPGGYFVDNKVRNALKSIRGVLHVEVV